MSFRIKIALVVGLVTGGIILSSVWLLWDITYHFNLETIDNEASQIIQSNIGKAAGVSFWKRLDDSLAQFNQDADGKRLFRLWVEPHGRKSYVSSDWPKGINPSPHFRAPTLRENSAQASLAEDQNTLKNVTPSKTELVQLPSLNEESGNERWRIALYYSSYGNLAVAFNVDSFDARMNQLRWRFLLVILFAIPSALIAAWYLAGRSLKPVNRLTATVESLTTQALDQRIEEIGQEKEFHRLVAVFNEMMGRLEKSFHQASRFSADASHELKTPLTRMQMELEKALKESIPGSTEQQVYSSLLDEIGHLTTIVKSLTLLSTSDAGKLQPTLETLDLRAILENVVEDWTAFYNDRDFELRSDQPVVVPGDRSLIEQAIQNLVSNAVKHGQESTPIRIDLSRNEQGAKLSITNQANPISVENQTKLFDRFFRTDYSRAVTSPGVGLGLSLTREIARAHGGNVTLVSSDTRSTIFELTLPNAEHSPLSHTLKH